VGRGRDIAQAIVLVPAKRDAEAHAVLILV
jgi:hypothetical protein